MAEIPEPFPTGPHVDLKTGMLMRPVVDWFEAQARGQTSNVTQIGGILSGSAQLQAQVTADRAAAIARDAAEQAARIANDIAVGAGGTGDPGEATSGNDSYSGVVSSGTTWITAATVTITPTGAGNYTIDVLADMFAEMDTILSAGTEFNGNWRIREEENGGGTPVTLDTGAFVVTITPEETFGGEGGPPVTVGPYVTVSFTGLPSAPIASSYAVMTDIRFELQRASGSNEIIAPGLSGSMAVSWA
jgi:hypothetical protein